MNQNETVIKVSHLSKNFVLPHERQSSLKGKLINFHKKGFEVQEALKDVSFEVKRGEFFGIVGRNGSGKSTLLKILAGIYSPDQGSVDIKGKLTPFIELGVGFNPELSGRDNVYLNGALLGFSRSEMEVMYDDIVAFAELERFMDQKLKNYSSGMQVRLAFSIAIRAKSDILVLDEVLAVGDTNFQKKCFDVFRQVKAEGRTVILVTHDMSAVQKFCSRAMLIEYGVVKMIGSQDEVARRYNLDNLNALAISEQGIDRSDEERMSEIRPVEIKKVQLLDDSGNPKKGTYQPKEDIHIRVTSIFNEEVNDPIIGISIRDANKIKLFDSNTKEYKIKTGLVKKGEKRVIDFTVDNIFSDGKYYIDSAIANDDVTAFYDSIDGVAKFHTSSWDYPSAIVQPEHTVKIVKD